MHGAEAHGAVGPFRCSELATDNMTSPGVENVLPSPPGLFALKPDILQLPSADLIFSGLSSSKTE